MLGIDTNVLVRFLTDDDPVQSPLALQVVMAPQNQPIHICLIALVETVWVLTRVKRLPAADVMASCRELLGNGGFRIENAAMVTQALNEAEQIDCDLTDALIALVNRKSGCAATATFDTRAQGLSAMAPVEECL